jgi:flavin reductase (DIM6/NTAB) family NADH-FMN oxidoreductase RutF
VAEPARLDILSVFWSPLCAVGSHDGAGRPNAQICVSVLGASVVADRPRVLVDLWKTNHTHDLVVASGTLALTLLSEAQVGLFERLGLHSGRDGEKLAGIEYRLTARGDPYFPGGCGYLDCRVIEAFDLGDATSFLCAVEERAWLIEAAPLSRARAYEVVGEDVMRRWREKQTREEAAARPRMRW